MSSVTLCLRSLSTISSKEVIPTLLDFECYKTGFIDEHCGVLTAVFCDLTIFKMKMSTSTLISFSSLFFCSDVTYFAEPQAFSKKGRILIQSSLQVESLDVLYLTNRFHMLPCIYYWTDGTWNLLVLYVEQQPFSFKFRHFVRHENSTLR